MPEFEFVPKHEYLIKPAKVFPWGVIGQHHVYDAAEEGRPSAGFQASFPRYCYQGTSQLAFKARRLYKKR
ncbi:hypothetical protein HMPREF9080_01759 [Cardiobacterium valvarum F0432]|uniref:Uncharacterized protein n=1 Tax=Cardiobacterium valvarum F0432 TaxID=797473 RepID=G9ZG45_9GAMM|nr:hypothetical protein HMPREF9080_01759 [Cardiobacterium valvarum F0432]